MAHRLIEQFVESLAGHPVSSLSGPNSPLLLCVSYSKNPEIPIDFLWISRPRGSLIALNEYYYHLCCEQRFREYIEQKVSKRELEDEYAAYARDTQAVYDEALAIDLGRASEEEILALLAKMIAVHERIADTIYIETLNYEIALRTVGREGKAALDAVWERAIEPTFISFVGRRLTYLTGLIKEGGDVALAVPLARYIYTDYHWSKSDQEIAQALEEIKSHLPEREEELKEIETAIATKKAEYDAWAQSRTEEEMLLADFIQLVMRLRDLRKDPIAQSQAVLILIATELLKRVGIDTKYGTTLTMYECLKGVDYLSSIRDELMRRHEGTIYLSQYGQAVAIGLHDYDTAVEEFYALTTKEDASTEVRGQVANKGKVTGTARVVLDPHDDKGFVKGDILVTSMTRPEFVPLMKLAGAVVTSEGGITCHAAIVSRELGIPCVIGTKNATRVLNDGDTVEVDANKGVVRILEKRTRAS